MAFQQYTVFFVIFLSSRFTEGIPDKSLIWAAHEQLLLYSPNLEQWTNAEITPTAFGQTVTNSILKGTQSVYGLAGDIPSRHLVSSDRKTQNIVIYNLDDLTAKYFHMGTSKDIGQLTVDWLGRNVYWADTGYGWIAMKKIPANTNQLNSADPNFRLVVETYLEKPTGIVVHPEKFFLFWTDTGSTLKIERSDLIGGNRKIIIWHSLIAPTTLCIDQSADRLYWSDPARRTIEYSDFDGNGRKILLSDPNLDYYGIAVFQDSLIYTAPSFNRTGYVSLHENNEGEHIQASIEFQNFKFYQIMVYASEMQKNYSSALCDKVQECAQICLHMEKDRGYTCLCDDGYELLTGVNCSVDDRVLERHILFTNGTNICEVPLSVLNLLTSEILSIHCNVVADDTVITRFSVDMTKKMIFYTNGTAIFKQTPFKDDRVLLYVTDKTITDMDYDWKTEQLYWIESADGYLYHMYTNATEVREPATKRLTNLDVTNLAVDPHNGKIFWISKNTAGSDTVYTLNVWNITEDKKGPILTSLLSKPTDLEYDRLKDRLLWNDEDGYVGMISAFGENEMKYDSITTGEQRHAITVYKNFIISTTAESRQFDIIYELDPKELIHVNLHVANDGPVLDFHVYESTLQPSNLEPCEVDNGGCEHICLPGNELKCACFLGYMLEEDKTSCKTDALSSNFIVILDTVHDRLYQIDKETNIPYTIEIDGANKPSALTFDPMRRDAIWVDTDKNAVKKKRLGSTEEIAVRSGVENTSTVAVDVSTGNIYISSGRQIMVVGPALDAVTIVDSTHINGDIGKIALMPESGFMSWFESGASSRIMIGNMDGTNVRPITVDIVTPEDISFDFEDEKSLFWCDSGLDKIEKIDTLSLATITVYKGRDVRPVAIEIAGDVIYLVPKGQRKIVQINKSNGLQQTVVFESPLFGSINNFFLSRNMITGHELCGSCNGGCSNLCLPIGESRRCACAQGISLKDDESTCQYANVCPEDSYTEIQGLQALNDCCLGQPDTVCNPVCRPGYNKQPSVTIVQCKKGKWNVTLDTICKEDSESDDSKLVYIAAGIGGGAALLVVVAVVCVCQCRRNKGKQDSTKQADKQQDYADGYARANGVLSPDPPTPTVEPVEPEEYDYLDEQNMLDASKLNVILPPQGEDTKKPTDRRSSTNSGRYSKFPIDYGYLTPSEREHVHEEPIPDYTGYTRGNNDAENDGYLQASSVGSASNGSFAYDPSYRHGDRQLHSGHFAVNFITGNDRNSSDGQVTINRNRVASRNAMPGSDGRRSWNDVAGREPHGRSGKY